MRPDPVEGVIKVLRARRRIVDLAPSPSTGSGRIVGVSAIVCSDSLCPELVEGPLGGLPSGAGVGSGSLLVKKLIKEILIQAGSIERIATSPMRQREPGCRADVEFGDLAAAVPCGMGGRCARSHDVGPHAVDLERATHPGDGRQLLIAQAYRRQQRRARRSWRAVSVRRLRRRRRKMPGRGRRPSGGGPPLRVAPDRAGQRSRPSNRSGPAAAVGAHLPQGSWFRSRSTGRRVQPRLRPARQSSGPSLPHPAAGRLNDHEAGSLHPRRESRDEPRPAVRARRPPSPTPRACRRSSEPITRSSVAPTGSSTNLAGRDRTTG